MNALWQCATCETINHGDQICIACGAPLTRRSAAITAVRGRVTPRPAPPTAAPLPEPIRRAINREPLRDHEWLEPRFTIVPLPGGCLFALRPRRRDIR